MVDLQTPQDNRNILSSIAHFTHTHKVWGMMDICSSLGHNMDQSHSPLQWAKTKQSKSPKTPQLTEINELSTSKGQMDQHTNQTTNSTQQIQLLFGFSKNVGNFRVEPNPWCW